MKVGDRVTFSFAQGEKEGRVQKIVGKKVYLRVDFPKHPGKLIVRKISTLEAASSGSGKKGRDKQKKKKKEKKEAHSKKE